MNRVIKTIADTYPPVYQNIQIEAGQNRLSYKLNDKCFEFEDDVKKGIQTLNAGINQLTQALVLPNVRAETLNVKLEASIDDDGVRQGPRMFSVTAPVFPPQFRLKELKIETHGKLYAL